MITLVVTVGEESYLIPVFAFFCIKLLSKPLDYGKIVE